MANKIKKEFLRGLAQVSPTEQTKQTDIVNMINFKTAKEIFDKANAAIDTNSLHNWLWEESKKPCTNYK